ncbi:MAG: hypothetical protein ACK53A_10500 [Gemmatimonadota bacterium]
MSAAPGRTALTASLVGMSGFTITCSGSLAVGMAAAAMSVLQDGSAGASRVPVNAAGRCRSACAQDLVEALSRTPLQVTAIERRAWGRVGVTHVDGVRVPPTHIPVLCVGTTAGLGLVRWLSPAARVAWTETRAGDGLAVAGSALLEERAHGRSDVVVRTTEGIFRIVGIAPRAAPWGLTPHSTGP